MHPAAICAAVQTELHRKVVRTIEPKDYIVLRIDGDYAYLAEPGKSESDNPVARALLPEEIEEGCTVHWEDFSYTMA